jgi:hypothetical protein
VRTPGSDATAAQGEGRHRSVMQKLRRCGHVAALVVSAGFLALSVASCDFGRTRGAVAYHDAASITLHLPPVHDVTSPESVSACREPDCVTGTLRHRRSRVVSRASLSHRPPSRRTSPNGEGCGVQVLIDLSR